MTKLRLGSIEFINSLPVDLGLLTGIVQTSADMITAAPNHLNQEILQKRLDVSAVSSLWYAQHAEDFYLVPNLSISSESSVDSVLLFSRVPMHALVGKSIGITSKGRTTPALLEILCKEKYGFTPRLDMREDDVENLTNKVDAILLIGDDALVYKERLAKHFSVITDLASEWRSWTGLPFVFAVWVARKEAYHNDSAGILELCDQVMRSKQWGVEQAHRILQVAQQRTNLPGRVLTRYFSKLTYNFDENLKNGLRRYIELAMKNGFVATEPDYQEVPGFSVENDRRS